MESWFVAMLVKVPAVVAIAFLYYVIVYKGSHLIRRFIPEGRVKEFLFRERGSSGTR
jgi:hypothetical protein